MTDQIKFANNLLNNLLDQYSSISLGANENLELEIRFKDVTRDLFDDLIKCLSTDKEFKNHKLECSINFISDNVYEKSTLTKTDETKYIRKITYEGSTPISDTYHTKVRVVKSVIIDDYIKYSVGLSKESQTNKFNTSITALVRFKVRVSAEMGDWRFDLTAVKSGRLNDLSSHLKNISKQMFSSKFTTKNISDELDHSLITSYEVEIEHIGKSRKLTIGDLDVTKKLFQMVNPEYLNELAQQEEIYHIASFIIDRQEILDNFKKRTHRLKQLANQVIALSKNTYNEIYPPKGYYVTDKADGQRVMISINGNRTRIIMSNSMHEILKGTFIPGPVTILDAEMIENKCYVFDVIVLDDKNVSKLNFSERCEILKTVNVKVDGYTIVNKHYVKLDNLEEGFKEIWEAKYPYELDGIIIVSPNGSYSETKNYKWKPYDKNTIDFLAMKCPRSLIGILPYEKRAGKELYLLFVGISHQMRDKLGLGLIPHYKQLFPGDLANYYPVQFSPSSNPTAYLFYYDGESLDKKIIELGRNEDNTEWVFHGQRFDRQYGSNYFGNDFRVAELTYMNYIDPFNLEDLWNPSNAYFTKTATDIYAASNKFKRFVISLLFKEHLSGKNWVIDLGGGRGADLHRYQEIGVGNVLFIDIDPTAIAELISRKFSFFAAKKRHIRNWLADKKGGVDHLHVVSGYDNIHNVEYDKLIVKDVKSMTIHTLVADLKSPYQELIASIFQYGTNLATTDGMVCNFAFHYMCDTIEHMRNLLMFIAKMLKIGGVFIFTVMDGASVFALLNDIPTGSQWESREGEILKYAIKKKYTGNKLSSAGQIISVLLPFSNTMYDEPLCNLDVVISEASKLGLEQELNSSMLSYVDRFAKADRNLSDKLTAEDKKYIGLHKYVTLRKIKEIKRDTI